MRNAVLTVYRDDQRVTIQNKKGRKDYVVVQDRQMSSILYRLCSSLHELTAITRTGDFMQLSNVTDELDEC
jgi:hypothetical protein